MALLGFRMIYIALPAYCLSPAVALTHDANAIPRARAHLSSVVINSIEIYSLDSQVGTYAIMLITHTLPKIILYNRCTFQYVYPYKC